jgi:hypothetical protein
METRLFSAIHQQLRAVLRSIEVTAEPLMVWSKQPVSSMPRLNDSEALVEPLLGPIWESTEKILRHLDIIDELHAFLVSDDRECAVLVKIMMDPTYVISVSTDPPERLDVFFMALWLTKHAPFSSSLRHRFALPLFLGSFDENKMYRQVCRKGLKILVPNLEPYKEQLLDAIIRRINSSSCDNRMPYVVFELIGMGLAPSVLIDLVREMFRMFKPSEFPLWAMEVLRVIARQLKAEEGPSDESDLDLTLPADHLMANEIIDRIKYCISEPGELSKDSLVRACFALEIACNCATVFRAKFSPVFIVRMWDIFQFTELFLPCDIPDESDLRLLFGLEVVDVIVDARNDVFEFFQSRLDSVVWPMVLARNIQEPNGEIEERLLNKVRSVLKKVFERTDLTSEELKSYYDSIRLKSVDVD